MNDTPPTGRPVQPGFLSRHFFNLHPATGRARLAAWIITLATLGAISVFDSLTPQDYVVMPLFLVSSLYATLRISQGAGYATVLLSVLLTLLLDYEQNRIASGHLAAIFNSGVRIFLGALVCQLVFELRCTLTREAELARTDGLTGLANRRTFAERLEQSLAQSRRDGQPFTVAFIDLDRFKQVNDRYGHAEGDRLLRQTATTIHEHLRATDLCARLGGDEFALLLPGTDYAAATTLLARLHALLLDLLAPHWEAGATLGAVTFEQTPDSAERALQLADHLMYSGKQSGRGRTVLQRWPADARPGDADSDLQGLA